MKYSTWRAGFTRALTGTVLLAGLAACGGDGSDDPSVTTTSGTVRGNETASTYSYLGIPYAAPPVGALRWKAPAAAASWTGDRQAKTFGPHCAQPGTSFGTLSTSEDCLYLNVYTPKGTGPYPVMVWIHGGAFYLGQSDGYDPTRLVEQGNIVVTINYRLGALGFMSHPALSAEQGGKSGNYGLMDQQAALRWVQSNISRFGGNASNVTIFGESAGGFSVHSHLASAGSTGLFHKAIIQSGAYAVALGAQSTLPAAEAVGSALTATACPTATADCLRTIPVATLLAAQSVAWPSGPIPSVDGSVLTVPVRDKLVAGTYNKVPVIQGTTKSEWNLFVALDELTPATTAKPYLHAPLTATTYPDAIAGTFPFLAAAPFPAGFASTTLPTFLYPASTYGSQSLAMGALGTDLLFTCNARWSSKQQKAAGATVYAYEFADTTVPPFFPTGISFPMGAAHTSELNYVFDTAGSAPKTAAQQAVAATIVSAWSRFAATGNPNPASTPNAWPALGASESVLSFDAVGTSLITDATFTATHKCTSLWTPGV